MARRKAKPKPARRTGKLSPPPAVPVDTSNGPRPAAFAWVLFGMILLAYAGHALSLGQVINDDAFISFRYSWNLAHGNGLVYNPGEHVEGFSNPLQVMLFTLVLSMTGWTLPAALAAGKTMGLLCGLAALTGLHGLARETLLGWPEWGSRSRWLALLPVALAAGSVPLAAAAMTGLETTLLAALLTLGLWALAVEQRTGRWHGSAILLALAALTRPEGALLAGAAAAGALLAALMTGEAGNRLRLRQPLITLGAIIAATAAWTLFRYFYFDGQLLPNTYYAKFGGFAGRSWFDYLASFFGRYGLFLVPLTAGLAALLRTGRRTAPLWPAASLVLVHLASFIFTGSDWMPGFRLLAPTVPAMAALESLGALALLALLFRRHPATAVRTWAGYLALGLLLAGQLQAWPPRTELRNDLAVREAGYREGHLALARWLCGEGPVPSGATVALMDIGLVGFLNPDLRILDISGLTDRVIARSPGGFLHKEYDPAYILDQRPEVVVITMVGPLGLAGPIDPGRLEPGTVADRRLFAHPMFQNGYRFQKLFNHRHPSVTYALAIYLRSDLAS